MTGYEAGLIQISAERIDGEVGQVLIEALNHEIGQRYAGDPDDVADEEMALTEVGPEEVVTPVGAFLVARLGDDAVACGALRRGIDGQAELKRMYVVPGARGRGVARALLTALEERGSPARLRGPAPRDRHPPTRGHGAVRLVGLRAHPALRALPALTAHPLLRQAPAMTVDQGSGPGESR